MSDFKQDKYKETFEATINMLTNRRAKDPSFSLADLEKLMKTEYINQGNDWVGRGSLQDIVVDATLAAYEVFYSEWKNEINN